MKWHILANRTHRGVGMEVLRGGPGGPYRVRERHGREIVFDRVCKDAKEVRRNLFASDQAGRRYLPDHWKMVLKDVKDEELRALVKD
ncbi:MAG: hypothetical protein R6U70_03525 [Bacillota bacterium]